MTGGGQVERDPRSGPPIEAGPLVMTAPGGKPFLYFRPEYRPPTVESTVQQIDHLVSGDWSPGLPVLWDMRGLDFSAVDAAAARRIAFTLARFPERKGARRGFLVDSAAGYSAVRMFEQTASGYGVEEEGRMIASYDWDELVAFLGA